MGGCFRDVVEADVEMEMVVAGYGTLREGSGERRGRRLGDGRR